MLFIEIVFFPIINALSCKNDFGENRIKFRLLVFELLTLNRFSPGSRYIGFPLINGDKFMNENFPYDARVT